MKTSRAPHRPRCQYNICVVDFSHLLEALSQPAAYPFSVEAVEVRHTHISVVFLAGKVVYKIKKPVDLAFLDFSTLEKRKHFCAEEVRLNRRLAPSVYLGIVPVTRDERGEHFEGTGEVIEWAVKMERLPAEAMLSARIRRGDVSPAVLEALARRLAEFHAQAEGGAAVAAFGRFDVVAHNARENFEQAASHVGTTLSRSVFDRLRQRTEAHLERLRPLIEHRAGHGRTRDTHGDLHLDHVYFFPERAPPADLVIVDCIEFNERFRYADPVADMAFLVMDLIFHGRRDLARTFADAYFDAANDVEGRPLMPFYTAYRAAVRGKVEGIRMAEPEIPEEERRSALGRARARWLVALGELETSAARPCLILVGGLPGSGKSTLSRDLAEAAGCTIVRSDVIRKELAGRAETDRLDASFYSSAWNDRTYGECLRRVDALLFEGQRVIVDASFIEDSRRLAFLEAARRWGVPAFLLHCRADGAVVRERLHRRRNDASDADWAIHQRAAERWQEPSPASQLFVALIDTSKSPEESLQQAMQTMRERRLAEPEA